MADDGKGVVPGSTNDSWRTWLMTGARRIRADRRRITGANRGLKKILLEGRPDGDDRPVVWRDFSGAMVRHAVDEAMQTLEPQETQVVKLAYFSGLSNREIAAETGLTERAVGRRLRHALAAISEHIQHGRALGRKAVYAIALWLSGRWLSDMTSHLAPAVAVAAVTIIVVAQPAPSPSPSSVAHPGGGAVSQPGVVSSPPGTAPSPKQTLPPAAVPALPVPTPPLQLPLPVPTPPLPLPLPLPTPPIHVPLSS